MAELPVAELPQSAVLPPAVSTDGSEIEDLDAVLPQSAELPVAELPQSAVPPRAVSTDGSEIYDLDPTESEPEDCKRPASNTSGSASSGTVAVQPKAKAKGKATAMCATKAHAKAKKTKASASKEANAKKTKKASASKGCKITCREPPEGMTAMVIKRVTHHIPETPVEPSAN